MGKVRVQDLMIGDWVKYSLGNKNCRITTIDNIEGSQEVNLTRDRDNWINAWAIDYIPLTDEILQKIGFEPLDHSDGVYEPYHWVFKVKVNGVEISVEAQKRAQGNKWIECLDSNLSMHICIQIDYVHQLQHIFKICGIDKEIKL
jgi:hypothetical protein